MFPPSENEPAGTPLGTCSGVPKKHPTIAIDGPAASGKTTVGRLLACKLGLRFLDTGVMYRALAWNAMRKGVPLSDGVALGRLAGYDSFEFAVQDSSTFDDARDARFYTPEVDAGASEIAQRPEVREALVRQQQGIASKGSIVMVGRDIGTIVAPDATLKVFLMASAETRARRRAVQAGDEGSYDRVLADMNERDGRDSRRSHSPLVAAHDAHRLDTEGLDAQQVVDRIISLLGAC